MRKQEEDAAHRQTKAAWLETETPVPGDMTVTTRLGPHLETVEK